MPSINNYMRSARLDKKVEIYQEVEVVNPTGSVDFKYQLMSGKSTFARIRYVSRTQKESITAGRETSVQEVHFDIRYRTLDKVKVILYDGSAFDIITLIERGRRQLMTCVCTWRDSDSPELDLV